MEKKTINVGFTVAPTVLHAGIFIAVKKGYYQEEGVHVKYCWPKSENQSVEENFKESINELSSRKADVIFGSFNSVIYHNIIKNRVPLVGLCGLTQRDVCGLAVLKKSNIESPKKLAGKKVGIFGLPFEQECIEQVIKSDGGNEKIKPVHPPFQRLICDLREEKYEACTIIAPWHVAQAQKENIDIKVFYPERYGIPRHYPLLVSLKDIINEKKTILRSFLRATARGYQELFKSEPREVAKILSDVVDHENMKDIELLERSLMLLREYFHEGGSHWGFMREEDWRSYVHFLSENQLLRDEHKNPVKEEHVQIKSLFDNELLGSGTE